MPHLGCPRTSVAPLCDWPSPPRRLWPRSGTPTGSSSHVEPWSHIQYSRQRPGVRPTSAASPAASGQVPQQPAIALLEQSDSGIPCSLISIWWDLDNVAVQHPAHLPLVARRLLLAVRQRLVPPDRRQEACQLTAYANERTLAGLGGAEAAAAALGLVGGQLVPRAVRR